MIYFTGKQEQKALDFIIETAQIALNSTCQRSKCGSIIVNHKIIIGMGYNSPPQNKEENRRCKCVKDTLHKKVTDKTCCIHAEQRAIMNALTKYADKIYGSRLYFVRLNDKNEITRSGKPYCTICSKMALDVGIAEFVLYHEKGICVYKTDEYNDLSYEYNE